MNLGACPLEFKLCSVRVILLKNNAERELEGANYPYKNKLVNIEEKILKSPFIFYFANYINFQNT